MPESGSPFLVFVHVEKAGGISLHNALHNVMGGYVSPSPQYGTTFAAADLKWLQRLYPIRVTGLGGHRISPTQRYADHQFRFSLVREPLARCLSHLNWQIEKMGIDWTLDDFLADPHFNNFQTFRLTGSRDFSEARSIILKHYDFIGLLENYDLSVRLLSKRYFGEAGRLKYEKLNVTESLSKRFALDGLSSNQLAALRNSNRVDLDVYRWIREEYFPSLREETGAEEDLNNDLNTPMTSKIRRKLSNAYVGRILQPIFQSKITYGY